MACFDTAKRVFVLDVVQKPEDDEKQKRQGRVGSAPPPCGIPTHPCTDTIAYVSGHPKH